MTLYALKQRYFKERERERASKKRDRMRIKRL